MWHVDSDMKILVLGYGYIGAVVAADISENLPSAQVVVAGRRRSKAEEVAAAVDNDNVTGLQLDARHSHELVHTMKAFDVVVGALPGNIGFQSIEAAIAAEVNMVDVSFMPEDPFTLNEAAIKAGVTVVPDCGVAPGLSNLLVGHAVSELNQVESVHIMVGGLPVKPVPPLNYTVTWSVESLIDEYTRKASIVKNGKTVEVEALTGLERIDFPGLGELEAFYTDGLRTLLHSVKAPTMWEKTLRYPGHAEKIRFLKALGYLEEMPVEVGELQVRPRKLTAKLLEYKLAKPDVPDLVALKVEVAGKTSGLKRKHVYHLLDYYDRDKGVTAMARTTGYPTSILAQLVAQEADMAKGVVPLEKVGVDKEMFNRIMVELEKRQIKIVEDQS